MLKKTPFAAVLFLTASMYGQSVISAHSGVIHYTEGQVSLDGKAYTLPKFGEFGDVKVGQTLATEDGNAEVLLTPGVFLRLDENSSFKMIANKLDNTRVEAVQGSLMIEVGELLPDNAITIVAKGADIALLKKGLYRVDAMSGVLRVYDGEARVTSGSQEPVVARKGRRVLLGDKLEASNFDTKETDAFYRWSERRDEYVAQANISAAKNSRDNNGGFISNGYAAAAGYGSWAWNPWFGMFTYVPFNGMFMSPFGFGYYSPLTVGYLYSPYSPFYYGGGYPSGYVSRSGVPQRTLGPGVSTGAFSGSRGSSLANNSAANSGLRGGNMGGGPSMGGFSGASSGGGLAGGGSSGGGMSSGGGHVGGGPSGGGGGRGH
jgi:hypothetical protein